MVGGSTVTVIARFECLEKAITRYRELIAQARAVTMRGCNGHYTLTWTE
jgi:hypothetical protein